MKILAIESSCDETAAAVVENGQRVRSNVIASQIDLHQLTGGVVPEVAARAHMKVVVPVVQKALEEANCKWSDIDALAVAAEPGLVGSLIVGRMTAYSLGFAKKLPVFDVNHIHGHLYSSWLDQDDTPEFPILVLTVSGGHNELLLMRAHGEIERLGATVDDAAGEAFDKTARLLGLGYPGGPAIQKASEGIDLKGLHRFPLPQMDGFDFSFSGLKTSVLYYVQKHPERMSDPTFIAETAASFQAATVKQLIRQLKRAAEAHQAKEVHIVGGVSANLPLREAARQAFPDKILRTPKSIRYCTDNAAMIGAAGYWLNKTRLFVA